MDFFNDLKDKYWQTGLYYIMTAAFLLIISCLIQTSICKFFRPKLVKLNINSGVTLSDFQERIWRLIAMKS